VVILTTPPTSLTGGLTVPRHRSIFSLHALNVVFHLLVNRFSICSTVFSAA
jgi:hypothetical protein